MNLSSAGGIFLAATYHVYNISIILLADLFPFNATLPSKWSTVRAFCSQKSLFAHRELAEVLGIAIHVSRLACSNGHVFIHLEADRTEWCACHISMTVFARCWGTVRESHIDRLPLPRRSWNKVEGFATGVVIRQWKLLIGLTFVLEEVKPKSDPTLYAALFNCTNSLFLE